MDITPPAPENAPAITAYGPGRFSVRGIMHTGGILILPDRVLPWAAAGMEDVREDSLSPALAAEPPVELLLIGTGAAMAPPPPDLRRTLRARGVALEIMATGAACRSHAVLLSEGRRIAAALLPLPATQ